MHKATAYTLAAITIGYFLISLVPGGVETMNIVETKRKAGADDSPILGAEQEEGLELEPPVGRFADLYLVFGPLLVNVIIALGFYIAVKRRLS